MHRSLSHGHGPRPEVINIYNEVNPDIYAAPPSPDRGRPAVHIDDLDPMFIPRSRSRGYTDAMLWEHHRAPSPGFEAYRSMEERIKTEYEIRRLKDEARRKGEALEAEERERHWEHEYELKKAQEKQKAKDAEKAVLDKIAREKREEEEAYKEFELKQALRKEEEKKKKEKEEAKIEEELRARLRSQGFREEYIDAIVKKPKKHETVVSGQLVPFRSGATPTYAKIHRKHLDIETLRFFHIPWEYDVRTPSAPIIEKRESLLTVVSLQTDPNYYVLLQEMDQSEFAVLFDHSKRVRRKELFLEPKKTEKAFAWVRHKPKERARSRSADKRETVIKIVR